MADSRRDDARTQNVVTLAPRPFLRAWLALAAILVALHLAEFFLHRAVEDSFDTSDLFFYLDSEGNLPTWVSSFGLLGCGVLSGLIARGRRSDRTANGYWVLAAAGFTFLSADELCQYHEHLTEPIWGWLQSAHLGMGGYLRNAWVLPVLIALPIVVGSLVPFLPPLPPQHRRRLVLAATVYLSGAVFMDMISGHEYFRAGGFSMTLLTQVTIEETLELVGMGLFLHALLAYLADQESALRFRRDGC